MKSKKISLPQPARLFVKRWNGAAKKRCALHAVAIRTEVVDLGRVVLTRGRRARLSSHMVVSFDVAAGSDVFYSIVRQAANACEPVQVGLETANVRVLWNGYPVVKPFKVPPVGDLIVESFDLHVTERAIWRQEMAWVRST